MMRAGYQTGKELYTAVKMMSGVGKALGGKSRTAAGNVLTTKYTPAAASKFKARKKLSKRKIKFYKKVKEVIQDEIGTVHQLRCNTPFNISWSAWTDIAPNGQGANAITLAPLGGNVEYHNDVRRMFSGLGNPADIPESWVNLQHGIVDIVIGNQQVTNPQIADVDVYELVCIKDIPLSVAGNPLQQLTNALIEMDEPTNYTGAGVFNLNISELGVTPFQAYTFVKYWKLTGKKKLFLGPGEFSHLEYKQTYNDRKIFGSEAQTLLAKAGTTKCYIVIANSVDRNAGNIDVFVNKRYSYKSDYIKTAAGTSDNTL